MHSILRKFLVLVLAVSACAGVAHAADNDAAMRAWTVRLESNEVPKGELLRAKAGGVECGAGYVYAIQSRVFTNSNDLEFWCRSGPLRLPMEKLPRAADTLTTNVANIGGRLYDYQSTQVYDFAARRWVPSEFSKGPKPFLIQPKPGTTYVFSTERAGCPGLSIFSSQGYLGTVKTDSFSAAAVWGDRFIVNAGPTVAAPLPRPTTESCAYLSTSTIARDRIWAYGIYLTRQGSLLVGGSLPGYGRLSPSCHPVLLELGSRGRREVPVSFGTPDCNPGTIKEFYSFAPFGDGVLIGNYPLATLFRYDGARAVATELAAPAPNDWLDPKGVRYRESQSVVSAYGATFVGMYPWAELIVHDHVRKDRHVHRVIDQPRKDDSPTPYFWRIHDRVRKMAGVHYDRETELVYSLTRDGKPLRDEGLEPTRWGQRIPSIAVLSGRLCASTGSLAGDPYDQRRHPEIPPGVVDEYGRVLCAPLPNHLLVPQASGRKATFRVTGKALEIEIDGQLVASTPHSLSARELQALRAKPVSARN